MLLEIKQSKGGETLVLTDPKGEVHVVTGAEDLWSTVSELLKDGDMPPMESQPAPAQRTKPKKPPVVEDDGDYDDDDEGGGLELGDDVVADLAGRALTGLLGGLQRASFRGKKRRRPPKSEDEGSG